MRSIFGHYIGEPEIEIVVQNDAAMAAMETYNRLLKQSTGAQRMAHANTLRSKLMKAGVAASTVAGIIRAVKNYAHFETRQGDGSEPHGSMRDRRNFIGNVDVSNRDARNEAERIRQRNQRHEVQDNARNTAPMEVETDLFGNMEDDSLPDLPSAPNTEEMEAVIAGNERSEPEPEATLSARAGPAAGMASTVSKETPISIAQPSYGLQETHTAILPWTGYLSAGGLDKTTPLQLKLRMNTPYDMVQATIQANPGDGTALVSTKGFYGLPINPSGRTMNNAITGYPTPTGLGTGTTATERPAWRDYWNQIYEWYTVIGCEYEIILHNPIQVQAYDLKEIPSRSIDQTPGATVNYPAQILKIDNGYYNTDVICATQFDTYSGTATTVGNVMPEANYIDVRAFKNIHWHPIKGGKTQVVSGVYRPGQAKRNIINDGDVKTWTKTGEAPTTLQEILTLNFWCDPMFNAAEYVWKSDAVAAPNIMDPTSTLTAVRGAVNIEVNLKYIVQFKDLRQQARYPNTISAALENRVLNLSNDRTNVGNPMQTW